MPILNLFDKSKVSYHNRNDLGHSATSCGKPKAALVKEKSTSYEKKNSYEDLKKENERLKAKLKAMVAKHKGRVYIYEAISWDDTNSDVEPVQSNYAYALMADMIEESSSQDIGKGSKIVWVLDSGCSRHTTGSKSLLMNVVMRLARL